MGESGFSRGEERGAIRGEPPMGRYLGVDDPVVGLRSGEEGNDRAPPDPLDPGLLSSTDKNDFELEELCRECRDVVRFVEGDGLSINTALHHRQHFHIEQIRVG